MYKDNSQLRIEDFVFPYGKLDPENDWVKLAELVPWDVAEERYAARFVNNGHPAHPARMALGALLIQRRLKCSDEWLVKHIGENPYLQYFIGMKEYGSCPFGASTLVAFRKRFSEQDLAAILEASVPKAETEEKDDSDDGNDPPNSGTLVLDATCCPADIAYPQDIDLLNQAREKAEKTVDELCKMTGQKIPRMYRKRARKDYLHLSKSKKRSAKAIRSAVRKQLQYIRRDIGYVAELVQKGTKLSSKQADRLNVVTTVYEQQRIMFESGTHSIPRRIVSLAQPWVRPIVRGKAHANTEFGPKLHISLVTATPESNDWTSSRSMNRKASGGRWISIGSVMDVIRNAFWRTRSTGIVRPLPFAKSMGSVCPAPLWASRQKIRSFPVRLRNRSIRTVATATLWRVFSGRPRPLMAWPASRLTYRKPLPVSLALPCCS